MKILPALFLMLLTGTPHSLVAQAPDTIRFCTYNVGYFDTTESERLDELRMILGEIRPAVLAIQGLHSVPMTRGASHFFIDSILSSLSGKYARLGYYYVATSESDLSPHATIFYDSSRIQTLFIHGIRRGGIAEMLVRNSGDRIVVATIEGPVGSTDSLEMERIGIAAQLHWDLSSFFSDPDRDNWVSDIVILGTLGNFSSDDSSFRQLSMPPTDWYHVGQPRILIDAAMSLGEWSNNPRYAHLHTYKTHSTGAVRRTGMQDRFDHILISPSSLSRLVPGSYHVFGNDGQHFGDSINHGVNLDVSDDVADALHRASLHVPVYIDLIFGGTSSVEAARDPLNLNLSSLESGRFSIDSVSLSEPGTE